MDEKLHKFYLFGVKLVDAAIYGVALFFMPFRGELYKMNIVLLVPINFYHKLLRISHS